MFKKMKVTLIAVEILSNETLLDEYLEVYAKQTGTDLNATDYDFAEEKEKFKEWLMKTIEENL